MEWGKGTKMYIKYLLPLFFPYSRYEIMAYLYKEHKITGFAMMTGMGGNGEFPTQKNGYGWKWEIFYHKILIWIDMNLAERGGAQWVSQICLVKGSTWQDYFTIKVCSVGKSDRRRDVIQGNSLRPYEWGPKQGQRHDFLPVGARFWRLHVSVSHQKWYEKIYPIWAVFSYFVFCFCPIPIEVFAAKEG